MHTLLGAIDLRFLAIIICSLKVATCIPMQWKIIDSSWFGIDCFQVIHGFKQSIKLADNLPYLTK